MSTYNDDWEPSKLPVSHFKVTTLERGNEKSHLDFSPKISPYQKKQGRAKPVTEEQRKQEAIDALQKAEQKAMLDKLFVETVDQEII